MFCANCNKDLRECTCPDLSEKIAMLEKSPFVMVSPANLAAYKAQAERNKKKADGEQQSLSA